MIVEECTVYCVNVKARVRCRILVLDAFCVLRRLLWPTVTLPLPSAFYPKSQPSSIRTLLAWSWSFYGFYFHENFWLTVAQQNAI